jgi:predicted nucleic acid-binding protein
VSDATVLGTSIITYVEARSALARRRQHGDLSVSDYRRATEGFEADWQRYVRTEVTEALLRDAAHLAELHRLRAYDAVHLAAAIVFRDGVGDETTFASWDDNLDRAAAREGFRLLRPRRR